MGPRPRDRARPYSAFCQLPALAPAIRFARPTRAGVAVGKFGLRALAQSIARELGPKGIHVAHVVIDGQIDTPRVRARLTGRDPKTFLDPVAIAESYWSLHSQDASAWSQEIDLRPSVEKF
jgi:NAD(P)-dependent dehydrogenase (short-subunit alcohol dehydrogenase family)